MLTEGITLGQLLDSGIRLSWQESLAITQSVAEIGARNSNAGSDCDGSAPSDLLSGFAVEADGTVTAVTEGCYKLTTSELALFLVQLLPGDGAPIDRRAPAAVHLAIGRALEVVEAPPFASVNEFTTALARLEQESRSELLKGVHARCIARLAPAREPASATSGGGERVPGTTEEVERDRRTTGPRVDALRRMIRERDHYDYLVRADRLAKRSRMSDRLSSRAHGPSIEMLRRWLREADRQQFEMLKSLNSPVPRRRSFLPVVALALGVCVTAGLGFVQRQPDRVFAPFATHATPGDSKPARATQTTRQNPSADGVRMPVQPVTPAEQSTGPATPVISLADAAESVDRLPSSTEQRGTAARRSAAKVRRGTDKHAASSGAARRAASAPPSMNRPVITTAEAAPDTTATALKPTRRWGPLRLLSAIRHRLSAAFNGA